MEQWTPQSFSLFNLDSTEEFFKKRILKQQQQQQSTNRIRKSGCVWACLPVETELLQKGSGCSDRMRTSLKLTKSKQWENKENFSIYEIHKHVGVATETVHRALLVSIRGWYIISFVDRPFSSFQQYSFIFLIHYRDDLTSWAHLTLLNSVTEGWTAKTSVSF